MSEDEGTLEERVQRAIVDRDKLKITQEHNAVLIRRVEIYRKIFESVRKQLGDLLEMVRDLQSELQDLEDID